MVQYNLPFFPWNILIFIFSKNPLLTVLEMVSLLIDTLSECDINSCPFLKLIIRKLKPMWLFTKILWKTLVLLILKKVIPTMSSVYKWQMYNVKSWLIVLGINFCYKTNTHNQCYHNAWVKTVTFIPPVLGDVNSNNWPTDMHCILLNKAGIL